jgi:hypothetical protein
VSLASHSKFCFQPVKPGQELAAPLFQDVLLPQSDRARPRPIWRDSRHFGMDEGGLRAASRVCEAFTLFGAEKSAVRLVVREVEPPRWECNEKRANNVADE